MAWSTDRKRRQSNLAQNDAANRACPHCGRGGALVGRSLPDRYVTYCKWWPQDKCDYNVIDFWKSPVSADSGTPSFPEGTARG